MKKSENHCTLMDKGINTESEIDKNTDKDKDRD
jgi:hypothetical protein